MRADIVDFFPSVTSFDFFQSLEDYGDESSQDLLASADDEDLLHALFLFGKDGVARSAIGYPCSPYIANIVMNKVDEEIDRKLTERQDDFGKAVYTRYADDITVSIDEKGFKKEVIGIIEGAIERAVYPRLSINTEKTKFGSRRGGSAFVTGLRICEDGRLTLHRRYKDHVRLLVRHLEKGTLDGSEISSLRGHLNYCSFADPAFYTKMVTKHFQAISSIFEEQGPSD